ncbi:MAG: DUF4332 domain-containing protein [Caldilineales bacterium]|nr:DUF4332 domain-containing protein [Caldilineales bacterium]
MFFRTLVILGTTCMCLLSILGLALLVYLVHSLQKDDTPETAGAPDPASGVSAETAVLVQVEDSGNGEALAEAENQAHDEESGDIDVEPKAEDEPALPDVPSEVAADDLTKITGIGPKVAAILQAHGINTFAQLAATDVEQLRQILDESGLRMISPETWPEQAASASQT